MEFIFKASTSKLPLLLLLFSTAGLSNAAAPSFSTQEGPGFLIVDPRVGTKLRREAFEDVISKSDVVYAGENPGHYKDHLAQLEILKIMAKARKNRVAVGFEMLNAGHQAALEAYAAGKLTEKEFLAKTDWDKEWGHDFKLYRPVFEFVRERGLKTVALNIPRGVISKLARGGTEALTSEEKALLPAGISVSRNKEYLDYLKKLYAENPASKTVKWADYLFSVSAWNEAMGSRVSGFLRKNPGYSFLVLAANGRIIYNAGLPASVKARTEGLAAVSIYTKEIGRAKDIDSPNEFDEFMKQPVQLADYVWFMSQP